MKLKLCQVVLNHLIPETRVLAKRHDYNCISVIIPVNRIASTPVDAIVCMGDSLTEINGEVVPLEHLYYVSWGPRIIDTVNNYRYNINNIIEKQFGVFIHEIKGSEQLHTTHYISGIDFDKINHNY